MFDTKQLRSSTRHVSAFITSPAVGASRFDVWAEAGRAIEAAYRGPACSGLKGWKAVAIAVAALATLGATGLLG